MSDLIIAFCERYSLEELNIFAVNMDGPTIQNLVNTELNTGFTTEEAVSFFEICLENYPF